MRRLFLAAPILALATAVSAQTVDQQGAAALAETLSRYVSKGAFDNGVLKIAPDGDAYRLDFDFGALVRLFDPPATVRIEIEPYAVLLKPKADGTWNVEGDLMPSGSVASSDDNLNIEWSDINGTMSGIFDPALPAFSSATGSFDTLKVLSSDASQESDATYTDGLITMTAARAASGVGVDYTTSYLVGDLQQTATYSVSADRPNFPVTIKATGLLNDASGTSINAKAVLDLLAFGIAHPDEEKARASQAELKSLLLAALPLWKDMSGSYAFDSLSVTTPAGILKTGKSSATTTMTGISDAAEISYGMKLSGIEIQSLFKPAWMTAVTPNEMDIGITVGGFRADHWVRKGIETIDLNKTPPLPDSFSEEILAELTESPPKLTLAKSTIRNDGVEITFGGEMTLAAVPVGSFDLAASGFDKIVEALALAASSDPSAEQMVQAAQFLQGYAKRGPDGLLNWTVKMQPDGAIFLNDLVVKPADQTP